MKVLNKTFLIVFLIVFITFSVDRISKSLILSNMNLGEYYSVIDSFFAIMSHRNTGAAFGILPGARWLFITFTIFVISFICYYLLQTKEHVVPYSFLIGGALGNLYDRIVFGEVIDFFLFKFGDYSFPVFNFADSFIVLSIIFIGLNLIRGNDERIIN